MKSNRKYYKNIANVITLYVIFSFLLFNKFFKVHSLSLKQCLNCKWQSLYNEVMKDSHFQIASRMYNIHFVTMTVWFLSIAYGTSINLMEQERQWAESLLVISAMIEKWIYEVLNFYNSPSFWPIPFRNFMPTLTLKAWKNFFWPFQTNIYIYIRIHNTYYILYCKTFLRY